MPKSQTDTRSMKSDASLESIGLKAGQSMQPQMAATTTADTSQLPQFKEFTSRKLEAEGGWPMDEYMYNCTGFVIFCPKHNRVVLSSNERTKAVWLPFIASPPNKTWTDATMEGISIVFSKEDTEFDARLVTTIPVRSINCLHILRIQLPTTKKFVTRLIQFITLGQSNETFNCCQNTKRLQWVAVDQAIAGTISGLWGPEVPIFCSFIKEQKQQEILEYGLDQAFVYMPKGGKPRNREEEMLLALKLTSKDLRNVYSDYLEHCFPAFFMTYWSFCSYIQDYIQGLDGNEVSLNLFQAFNYNKNGYLGFQEFLLGMASIEPNCPGCEARQKFIFRFYDNDQDDVLNRDEMLRMLSDLAMPANDAQRLFVSLNLTTVTWDNFYGLVKREILKTDVLCRASNPLLVNIASGFVRRNETRISHTKKNKNVNVSRNAKGPCLACRERKYEYATHCVRFDQVGRCIEPRHILEREDRIPDADDDANEMSMHRYSQDYVFSSVSIGHTFLDMIREFDAQSNQEKHGFFQNTESHEIFIRYVSILCKNVRSLFDCQEKVLKLNASVFVIGDIAGDLRNLLAMEQALWQSVPVLSDTFLFLGNYVTDNGSDWGIECVLYLFALKVVAPNKFYLLRGNNEIRHPDRFQRECIQKYGAKNGQIIYDTINAVFDRMSLAAIIDESILCVNSGVPDSRCSISDILNLPSTALKDPMTCPVAKEILTNNKCDDERIMGFLKKNGLCFVIRANLPIPRGFQISVDGKSIHIYTKPMAKTKEITFACVNQGKIRIVKIDNSGAKSVTE